MRRLKEDRNLYRNAAGHLVLPPEYSYLEGMHTEDVTIELLRMVEKLQARVAQLEVLLPDLPEEDENDL